MDSDTTEKTVSYWRHPTPAEIKKGEGAIHWLEVPISKVLDKKNKKLKKWFIHNGLRYNKP